MSLRDYLNGALEAGQLHLPLLPEVPRQVMVMVEDPQCDAKQLTDLIHGDAALAAQLLRLANSPVHAPRAPIVSLRQAVSYLGLRVVQSAVLTIVCQTQVFRVAGHEEAVRGLFRHALSVALFAREVARMRRLKVEEAFLCGLFHDIGKPVLWQLAADYERAGHAVTREQIEGAVAALHVAVGGRLAQAWTLPEAVGQAIRHHHDDATRDDVPPVALLTALANRIAYWAAASEDSPESDPQRLRDHPAMTRLNIYPDQLEGVLAMKNKILDTAGAMA